MTPFSLTIVTPDGLAFEGQVEELVVRTTTGDIGILAGHINCVAALGMGRATIVQEGKKRYGACIGGMVTVMNGEVKLVPTTFEWAEDIDAGRVEASMQRAKETLNNQNASNADLRMAEARMRRALVRKGVVSMK